MEAKNKMIFGWLKNHILKPQNGISLNFWDGWAVCAGPGEGTKGWGKALVAGILGFAFEAGLRGRHNRQMKGLMSCTHGSPFGRRRMCAQRTYRRAAGGERKA